MSLISPEELPRVRHLFTAAEMLALIKALISDETDEVEEEDLPSLHFDSDDIDNEDDKSNNRFYGWED